MRRNRPEKKENVLVTADQLVELSAEASWYGKYLQEDDGRYTTVTVCKDCGQRGSYYGSHIADPCRRCGGERYEDSGRWLAYTKKPQEEAQISAPPPRGVINWIVTFFKTPDVGIKPEKPKGFWLLRDEILVDLIDDAELKKEAVKMMAEET